MIAAADSGYDAAVELGLSPALVCGDMDSLLKRSLDEAEQHAEVVRVDRDKDVTDTELGLRLLGERGYTRTLLCGGGSSGRFDHELGVLWTFFRNSPPAGWIQPHNELLHLRVGEQIRVASQPGTVISCFPASTDSAFSFYSDGLKWPLQDLEWHRETVGISNEVISQELAVSVQSGGLLIVRPHSIDGMPNGDSMLEVLWPE